MTIGIYSCCYSTVVHVFTTLVLARVLPAFGEALASWTDTSLRGAGLWYSVVDVSSGPHALIQPYFIATRDQFREKLAHDVRKRTMWCNGRK
jgi:hypothetical protein